jgi:hypothetical protein
MAEAADTEALMFADDIKMGTAIRAFLTRHAALFGPLHKDGGWHVTTAVGFLGTIREASKEGARIPDRSLSIFAASLREYAAERLVDETALARDKRAGPGVDAFAAYADTVQAYVDGKGLEPNPLFSMTVAEGASAAETSLARATYGLMRHHAAEAIRDEMAVRPAWQHQPCLKGVEGMAKALDREFGAATVIGILSELQDEGPQDMFRVLVRHHGGLPEPVGMTPEQGTACAATWRSLADLGVVEPRQEDARTCIELAIPTARAALALLGRGLNAWLEEDSDRWEKVHAFPVDLPLPKSALADLKDLGLLERHRGKVRLTRIGGEACQLAMAPAAIAGPA